MRFAREQQQGELQKRTLPTAVLGVSLAGSERANFDM